MTEPVRRTGDMRDPLHDAYWDLRGAVAQWMEASGKDYAYTVLYLSRIVAELQMALHCNYQWRLSRLEQVVEVTGERSEGGEG